MGYWHFSQRWIWGSNTLSPIKRTWTQSNNMKKRKRILPYKWKCNVNTIFELKLPDMLENFKPWVVFFLILANNSITSGFTIKDNTDVSVQGKNTVHTHTKCSLSCNLQIHWRLFSLKVHFFKKIKECDGRKGFHLDISLLSNSLLKPLIFFN